MTTAWVLGSSGLLGTALFAALKQDGTPLFTVRERLAWTDAQRLRQQLVQAVTEFAAFVPSNGEWHIYWAAGVGTFLSTAEQMKPETDALAALLQAISEEPALRKKAGSIVLSSSAGAIYAGAPASTITEATPTAPTTAYAYAKLEQEALMQVFSTEHPLITTLCVRISILFGVGQAQSKQQGLLTQIARRTLRHQPVHIYVPFETMRDYITSNDAARTIIASVNAIGTANGHCMKIVASGQVTSIAEIISIFKRIVRRAPLVITSASQRSALYTRRMQFRSTTLADILQHPTSLLIGISQLLEGEKARLRRPENAADTQSR